jgi:hypothetical protein
LYGRFGICHTCDGVLSFPASIFCGCGWKERRNPKFMMTQDAEIRDSCSSWILKGPQKNLFVVCLFVLVCFVCLQVCNSMKMNLCFGFGDGVGLLLQMSWLLKKEVCESRCGSLDGGRKSWKDIKRRVRVFKDN